MRRLIFVFFVFWTFYAHAQEPPVACDGEVTLTSFCGEACILCEIDGFIGMNSITDLGEAPPDFCAPVLHNTQWVGFVAGSTNLTMQMTVFDCAQGDGLQVGIYHTLDCTDLTAVSNCIPAMPNNTTWTFVNTQPLEIGGIYFIVIDGNFGDVCSFEINITSGLATAPEITDVPEIFIDDPVCANGTFAVSSSDVEGASIYDWTLDGAEISYEQVFDLQIPEAGGTLCVTPSNPCHEGPATCIDLNVQPLPDEFVTETICEGETFEVYGQLFSTTGNHLVDAVVPGGCSVLVHLDLTVKAPSYTDEEVEICDGEVHQVGIPGQPGAQALSVSGSHVTVLATPEGCDSVVNTNLIVHPVTFEVLNEDICQGQSYTVSDFSQSFTYSETGIYENYLTSSHGCDSTVVLVLTVNDPPPPTIINEALCQGEVAQLGSTFYGQTGQYTEVFEDVFGCDSLVTLDLVVFPLGFTNLNEQICFGETYYVGSSAYTQSGSYTDELTGIDGCDSTVFLNLTVLPLQESDITEQICQGEYYTFNGVDYYDSGVYEVVIPYVTGCDEFVTLDLTVLPAVQINQSESICSGDSIIIGNTTYSSTGSYELILESQFACDTTVFLDLLVSDPTETMLTADICDGDAYSVGNMNFDSTGSYEVLLQTTDNCDSIVRLDLSVHEVPETFLEISLCEGEIYTIGNIDYDSTGNYTAILTSMENCDSIVYLDLQVDNVLETFLDIGVCTGQDYMLGDSTYTEEGMYTAMFLSESGCDSIVYLDLEVLDVLEETSQMTICDGESVIVGDSVYFSTGMYANNFVNDAGCDSIFYLDLTVNALSEIDLVETICEGAFFTVGTTDYDTSGQYQQIFQSIITGCDSIVNLDLTVLEKSSTELVESICEGESFMVGGNSYTQDGEYEDVFLGANGCDSIVRLDLTVLTKPVTDLNPSICQGEIFTVGNTDYSAPGTYLEILEAANGCDSTVNLNLTVLNEPVTDLDPEICEGEVYTVGNTDYSSTGTYQEILQASNGCDSIVNLNLVVHAIPETNIVTSICNGASYSVGSSVYSSTGIYQDILAASSGCDSIVNLDLTVTSFYETNLQEAICEGQSFDVGFSTYTTSGLFQDVLTSADGCDSIINLDLTVNAIAVTNLTEFICQGDSVSIGASVYNSSGSFQDVLSSEAGCDSIVNLDLTVNPTNELMLVESICFGDSYSVGSSVYDQSGSYMDVLVNSSDCDSIVHLQLTIKEKIETMLDLEICEGEVVSIGLEDFSTSGSYERILTASDGCDSTVYLDLSVDPVFEMDLAETICEGQSYAVGSSNYTSTGSYQDVLTASSGCDSVVNLNLMVYPVYDIMLSETICFGESFTVGSSIYDESGTYTDVLSTENGCDSIVHLALSVKEKNETLLDHDICEGAVITIGSEDFSSTGLYERVLTGSDGCDSTVYLDLFVSPVIEMQLTEDLCQGESITIGSSNYTTTGSYQDILTTSAGCDSIVNLELTVNPVYETPLTETICEGESFEVGGVSFNATGNFTEMLISQEGCDSTVLLDLTVYPCDLDLILSQEDVSCNGQADGALSFEMTVGTPPYNYDWHLQNGVLSGSGTLDANNQPAIIEYLPAGEYEIVITDAFDLVEVLSVEVIQPQALHITFDVSQYNGIYNLSCFDEKDGSVQAYISGGTPPYHPVWSTGESETFVLEGLGAGNYILELEDEHGCQTSASVVLTAPEAIQANVITEDPLCYGDELGSISLFEISGGIGPYLYSIDNAGFTQAPVFSGLGVGHYVVQVQDANGCTWEEQATIQQPEELFVNLGPDRTIELGEATNLVALTSETVDSFSWQGSTSLSCPNCPNPQIAPMETGIYGVTITDENGCLASDQITIFVEKGRDVFVPNVFSPNQDGQNDKLFMFGGKDVQVVKSFKIFNRWGEAMFEGENFNPNDPDYGWDGTYRGQAMNAGVYVYFAEVEFIDGEVIMYEGDIVLVR